MNNSAKMASHQVSITMLSLYRPSKTRGLIIVIWFSFNDLEKYNALQFIISMLKQIILSNIYIGWLCLKIMLQEDKCIYI